MKHSLEEMAKEFMFEAPKVLGYGNMYGTGVELEMGARCPAVKAWRQKMGGGGFPVKESELAYHAVHADHVRALGDWLHRAADYMDFKRKMLDEGATIVVAYAGNRVIGRDGKIPWHLPEDLKRFKKLTTGHVCIMGRKTYESLPDAYRPLPERENVVITRGKTIYNADDHFISVNSPEQAMAYAKQSHPDKKVFVIGGAEIYEHFLSRGLAREIIATEVKIKKPKGDARFPPLNYDWKSEPVEDCEEFAIVRYTKVR